MGSYTYHSIDKTGGVHQTDYPSKYARSHASEEATWASRCVSCFFRVNFHGQFNHVLVSYRASLQRGRIVLHSCSRSDHLLPYMAHTYVVFVVLYIFFYGSFEGN